MLGEFFWPGMQLDFGEMFQGVIRRKCKTFLRFRDKFRLRCVFLRGKGSINGIKITSETLSLTLKERDRGREKKRKRKKRRGKLNYGTRDHHIYTKLGVHRVVLKAFVSQRNKRPFKTTFLSLKLLPGSPLPSPPSCPLFSPSLHPLPPRRPFTPLPSPSPTPKPRWEVQGSRVALAARLGL